MSIQRVIAALDTLRVLHEQLLEIAEQKKGVITRNDVQALASLTSKENRILKLVTEADDERVAASLAFVQEKGIRSNLRLTVSELSRLVFQPEERLQLQEAQQTLNGLLNRLKEENQFIRELLQQSLDFVDYSLNIMTSRPEDESLYRHPQQPQSKIGRSMFDTRA
ncbi:flagellar protein FlgN [Paenibacillus arenosi]|uniref:Flagellar protein FlgN n=1 Tax=Paenibacillus arenosi TaxID=2774142 RepID=A0ABR9AWI8_9BACL|nr:flagellar protein FlgN [Paenibacillus arenosi]MBD8498251.1 flagellar protein FlgN [Paenibacillus arenosi]